MIDDVASAAATLRGLGNGLRVSQALYVAAELGVADHLSEQPLNNLELAAATGTDVSALGRSCGRCVHWVFFREFLQDITR